MRENCLIYNMIREIKIYPNKILSQKAKKVGVIDAETKKLIEDMVETLYAKGGAGLAANQVGVSKQIIVVDDSRGGGNVKILINPKILRKRGKQVALEGCLSLPGLELEIKRPAKIEVEYLNKEGTKQKQKSEDLTARIICHEIDHLDGKTILDRVGFFKRLALKRKLKVKN